MGSSYDLILVLVNILFPPAAVAMLTGCSCDLLINILLTLLGYFPGLLHGFWLMYNKMQAEERYGPLGYRYTGNGRYEPREHVQQAPVNYGATAGAAV